MLISVHIPKCAGTSFRHILQALYGENLWTNYGQVFTRNQARPGQIPARTDCIHGHFLADAFDDLYPQRHLLTWVRHPVERVVSNYYHFLRSPDMRDDCCRRLFEERLSLRQFAELDWMRNEATRYLAGKSPDEFAFIGVAESFTDSLAVFAQTFGWHCHLPARRENSNPTRLGERYELRSGDDAHIRELNAADLTWYQETVERLEDTIRKITSRAA
jgi:hypothetical protein